ncbi:hypothetical protein J2T09_001696 [Neorhizobium huautlense]|uniref:DUF930 domain-containing protein n=1 Tax=Neorhizobium huautlense TaxID=67774 RepID=A0ABT9PR58_9HYPH|nr:DUF930 domain-containing protein [Neorhizobium huautlense]MDP9836951.1 hypothetical protein [Neorhizobium huautlense]
MADDVETRNGMWRWGIVASFMIHGLIAFVILVGIPFELPKPEAEEVVSVEIVPPEQEKAEELPPPPAPSAEAEEEAQQQPEPPPASDAAQAPEEAGSGQPLDTFRPVVQFGDKDAGPEKAEDGASADKGEAAEKPPEPDMPQQAELLPQAEPVPENSAARDEPLADADAEQQDVAEAENKAEAAGAPVPEEITVPDVAEGPVASEGGGVPVPVPAPRNEMVNTDIAAAGPSESPEADQEAKPAETPVLQKAGQLFSPSVTDNPLATIAMGSMSRGERAAELCNTELREQLRHGSPAYNPNLLPKPRLTGENVIDARSIGFRARDRWYDVSFRCEVDGQAMKVVSFSHQVGGAIPKSEWRKRGFPAY